MAEHVKRVRYMAVIPPEERVVSILSDVKTFDGIPSLAKVSGVSERSLYRHAAASDAPEMSGKTLHRLVRTFGDLGLLADYDLSALAKAVEEIKRQAAENELAEASPRDLHDRASEIERSVRDRLGGHPRDDNAEDTG